MKKTKKIRAVAESVEAIEPGHINIPFSQNDLVTFANLLSICAQTFQQLALQAAKENDEKSFDILSARHQLSSILANRFVTYYKMGEPSSRGVH